MLSIDRSLAQPAPVSCKCLLCGSLLHKTREPIQLVCPGDHTFCRSCLGSRGSWCEICQFPLPGAAEAVTANEFIPAIVESLDARCVRFGCSWTGVVAELETHSRVCAAAPGSFPSPMSLASSSSPSSPAADLSRMNVAETHEQFVQAVIQARKDRAELNVEEQLLMRAHSDLSRIEPSAYEARTEILELAEQLHLAQAGLDPHNQERVSDAEEKPDDPNLVRDRAQRVVLLKAPSDAYIKQSQHGTHKTKDGRTIETRLKAAEYEQKEDGSFEEVGTGVYSTSVYLGKDEDELVAQLGQLAIGSARPASQRS